MNWGLIVVCAVALGLFALINRDGKRSVCPKGCHGCGKCMTRKKGAGKNPKTS